MSWQYWNNINQNLIRNSPSFRGDNVAQKDQGQEKLHRVFIVAPPRGGSTLLQQILISSLELGYVSNVMAPFWLNPDIGAILQNQVQVRGFLSNFKSEYGNTTGPLEPHEWGWFWQHWLNLKGDDHYIHTSPDWAGLERTLLQIGQIFNGPVIFDNVFACANIAEIEKSIGPILVLNLTRSPWHVCNSMLNARVSRYNDINRLYGYLPRMGEKIRDMQDPVEQVVVQCRYILDEIEEALLTIPKNQILNITYAECHRSPNNAVDHVQNFLKIHGAEVARTGNELSEFEDRNVTATTLPGLKDRLNTYFEHYFPDTWYPDRQG